MLYTILSIIFLVISFIFLIVLFFVGFHSDRGQFLIKICLSIITACISYLFIQHFQQQNTLINEPLIIKDPIKVTSNGKATSSSIKVNITIPLYHQGMFASSYLLYFHNDSKGYKVIPTTFSRKNNKLSATLNVPIIQSNSLFSKNPAAQNAISSQKIANTIQLGLIAKDCKGNIITRYFIIRPEMKCHNREFKYQLTDDTIHKVVDTVYLAANNRLDSKVITLPVSINNKCSVEDCINDNKDVFNVNFHLMKHSKISFFDRLGSLKQNIKNFGLSQSLIFLTHPKIDKVDPTVVKINYFVPKSEQVWKNIQTTLEKAKSLQNNIN